MSFCFINLFVTIWCKDNKLIIYLSIYINIFGEPTWNQFTTEEPFTAHQRVVFFFFLFSAPMRTKALLIDPDTSKSIILLIYYYHNTPGWGLKHNKFSSLFASILLFFFIFSKCTILVRSQICYSPNPYFLAVTNYYFFLSLKNLPMSTPGWPRITKNATKSIAQLKIKL
jgi:hypothetical protein